MDGIEVFSGKYASIIDAGLTGVRENRVVERLWDLDHTLYSDVPDDILNRLGWLTTPEDMRPHLDNLNALAQELIAEGVQHVVVLGMGGAGLAAEVMIKVFGNAPNHPELTLLDTTDPEAIHTLREKLSLEHTVFIYSMKKWALETYSLFKYFYNELVSVTPEPGKHFIAITDAGAWVPPYAEKLQFRRIFLNDPNIGGRYAALSYVGMLPAAFIGADTALLLARAQKMMQHCKQTDGNPAAVLGAFIGELAAQRIDKLTFFASAEVDSWLDWVEQLLAESTGKNNTGILAVIREDTEKTTYSQDRAFVHLRLQGDETHDALVQTLIDDGRPVIRLHLQDSYDLGAQFYLWCFATAIAGERLGIQPFNQPNVETTKIATNTVLKAYQASGTLPKQNIVLKTDDVEIYGDTTGLSLRDAVGLFLKQARKGAYVGVHAYFSPFDSTPQQLSAFCAGLHKASGLPITLGYGPRFLHSTGQLHKGDAGRGLFIQMTKPHTKNIPVPHVAGNTESLYTFDVLEAAQYIGDMQALQACHPPRPVIRIHLLTENALGILNKTLQGMTSP